MSHEKVSNDDSSKWRNPCAGKDFTVSAAEGWAPLPTTPPVVSIELDVADFMAAVSTLTDLAERLPELLQRLVHLAELGAELATLHQSDESAGRTGEIRARLEPSDRLVKLVAALTACERELLVAERLAHA